MSVTTASRIIVLPSYVMVMVPSASLQFTMTVPDSSSILVEEKPELAVMSAMSVVIVYVPAGGIELSLSA